MGSWDQVQIAIIGFFGVYIVYLVFRFRYERSYSIDILDGISINIREMLEEHLISIDGVQYRLINAEELLTNHYLDKHIKIEHLEEYPPYFTGMGILGTFIGIVYGLWGFGGDVHSNAGIDVLQTTISSLVTSLSISFATSIGGLVCSLGTTSSIVGMKKKVEELREMEISRFNTKYKHFSITEMMIKHLHITQSSNKIAQKQVAEIRNLADMVAEGIERAMMGNDGRQGIVQLLQSLIAKQDKIGESFQNSLDNALGQMGVSQTESLGQLVDQFSNQMNASFGERFSSLGVSIGEMTQSTSVFQNSMEKMIVQLQETIEQQKGSADHVNTAVHSTTETLQKIEAVVGTINTIVSNLSNVGNQLNSNIASQNTFNKDLVEHFETSRDSWLKQQIDISKLSNGLVQGLSGLTVTISELQRWHAQVHNELQGALEAWNNGLVQQKEVNDNISKNQEDALLVSNNLISVSDTLTPITEELHKNTERLKLIMEAVSSNFADLHSLGALLKEEHAAALGQWEGVQNSLVTSSDAMSKGIQEYADHVHTFTIEHLNNYNATLDSAIRHLATGVTSLHDITIEIQSSLEILQRSLGELEK